jgi:AhpD family alkylhydroperoxidase
MSTMIKTLFAALALATIVTAPAAAEGRPPAQSPAQSPAQVARADIAKTLGFVPGFFDAFGEAALPGSWDELKGLQLNPNTALPGASKELIGLGVASQIPCKYCVYAHTEFAELNGATAAQAAEAVAVAGMERHFSAYFFGLQLDQAQFKSDIARIVANAKKPQAASGAAPIQVVDAKSALLDIERTLGFVPDFMRKLPESALPGVWREMKELKLNPNSALSAKQKALISLAVASQVPSVPCIVAETEFAKLAGASEREIAEAVGMAAITRNMSTMLNGDQVDERAFRADVARLVSGVKAAQKKAASTVSKKR